MRILGVIPARYASTRFPGKPLVDIAGKSMIQRVYERAATASGLADLVVATDDARIFSHVRDFNGNVLMTSDTHPSGTDRVLEVAEKMADFDAYVNIQGDEPIIEPSQINQVCDLLKNGSNAFAVTLVRRLNDLSELQNPNTVKVVFGNEGRAIYFSRSPIPYIRDADGLHSWQKEHGFHKHIGIYGYSKPALGAIAKMSRSTLEIAESLEQLRWLENGLPIFIGVTDIESWSIDSPSDLAGLLSWMEAANIQ